MFSLALANSVPMSCYSFVDIGDAIKRPTVPACIGYMLSPPDEVMFNSCKTDMEIYQQKMRDLRIVLRMRRATR
jgi:hypothetical protein